MVIMIMLKIDNDIIVSIVLAYPVNGMRYFRFKQKYSTVILV